MRYVRSLLGVGALLVGAGGAAAQPGAFPGAGERAPGGAPSAPISAPASLPPASTVPSGTAPAAPVRSLAALSDDHLPVKDLTPHGGFGDIHPPADHGSHEVSGALNAVVPSHGGWYVSAEYLLMRPRNSDLDFAIRNTAATGLATTGPIDSLKYQLGSGIRAGLGYVFDGGKWEATFQYTYQTAGGDSTVFAPAAAANPAANTVSSSAVLFPTLTRPGLTDRALSATATADLDYQLFDMVAGRRFVVSDNLAVRALAGFRFADIRQTFNAFYDGADARKAAVKTRSRFEGFGPTLGAEGTLAAEYGFHLYARGQFGFLSGRSTNQVLETNDSGATTYVNVRNDTQREVPFGTVALGLGWQYRTIALRAGYEVTHWQDIFSRPRFTDDVGQGKVINRPSSLSLEGLFIQASVIY
ncbi:Lpg1974 family pore-forming outer membrane protein [Gemmata sp. JC717]|uniref:Lpg1974 family pore-forming outer membrane protein n=1 Tax=Gemmata algarum TaxID=2975278 RepID=UPI0021BAA67F|nr:Lpg1974 family pore-forming outer membrane protein [Gemmata algarum]MDY3553886.1 Lpg1974 family pore-forming outer membrane protein [Gemmata algarum]